MSCPWQEWVNSNPVGCCVEKGEGASGAVRAKGDPGRELIEFVDTDKGTRCLMNLTMIAREALTL